MNYSQEELCRKMTEENITREMRNLVENYMKVYDEYYSTGSRHSAFIKDLVDTIVGISAVLEVYTRDKKIDPDYAVSHLLSSKSYIDAAIEFFKSQMEIQSEE